MIQPEVEIKQHSFTSALFNDLNRNHYAKDLWPLVYILSDGETREAYVGETTDVFARMNSHMKHSAKSKLTSVHLITSEKFNKSATLDIESNLIKYIAGDGQYKLMNANLGLANHNYYQKQEVYWDVFQSVWSKLRKEGITKHSLEHIDNSDLFKYSPYKNLTIEQSKSLLQILSSIETGQFENIIVEGGAGTGKTILAIFLFKILSSDLDDFNFKEFGDQEEAFIQIIHRIRSKYPRLNMALVVPMASFRSTLQKVFKNIQGLKASMVIGPAEVARNEYDIVVVDESHRLRRRANLGTYFGAFDKACEALGLDKQTSSELNWITMKSKTAVLFYDEAQSIKPSDAKKADFDKLKASSKTVIQQLKSQFRVKGGNAYVDFIDQLLNCKLDPAAAQFNSQEYELEIFDSLEAMVDQIKKREDESGLSRLIAGFSWPWISNKSKDAYDIVIGDVRLKWNNTSNDWINSEGAVNEVGCIHTTQGYDLNYSGIIFGNEISYDKVNNEIVINPDNYFDKNGKQSIKDPSELKAFIINIYKTILLRAIKGTYIYVCDDALREYLKEHIPTIESSAAKPSVLKTISDVPFENAVPLYDLEVAAGNFGDNQNIEGVRWIELPAHYKTANDKFACQVMGESMNKIIKNGSYCLFKKYNGGSRNGLIVLAEHTHLQDPDSGSCYTIKEYESKKSIDEEGWSHQTIWLKPQSYNDEYQTLELTDSELDAFRVLGVFECVLT